MKDRNCFRMRTIGTMLLALTLTVFPATAFGQQMQDGGQRSDEHDDMMGARTTDRQHEMIGGAHGGGPIESEEDFLLEMIPHHLEAADAAVLVAVTTGNEEIRSLTENIYRTQYQEVEGLKILYASVYRKLPVGRPYERMMRNLNVVEGEARDRQFVEDMIPHHEAAVWMAREVLELTDLEAETRRFAEQVIRDQEREMAFMKEWLAEN